VHSIGFRAPNAGQLARELLRYKVVLQSLQDWAQDSRHLMLIARSYDAVWLLQRRFVSRRMQCDHMIDCRIYKSMDTNEFPSAILEPYWSMHRLDLMHNANIVGCKPKCRIQLKEA
jgi:hypothetical protein